MQTRSSGGSIQSSVTSADAAHCSPWLPDPRHAGAARGGRLLALLAVAFGVLSWGVAQWPYLLPQSLTFQEAAAPSGTLTAVLVAVVLAALLVVPGFVLLYVLDQRGLLPEEGVADADDRSVKET